MKKNNYVYLSIFFVVIVSGILLIKMSNKRDFNKKVVTNPTAADVTSNDVTDTMFSEEGIFEKYYKLTANYIKNLSLDEKLGQLLLVNYSNDDSNVYKYNVAGFIFHENDFKNKNKSSVLRMMDGIQDKAKTPYLMAVNEEGGKVVSVSSNDMLVDSKYKSLSELYTSGGIDAIRNDTIKKSKELKSLGINVNLAPVVDVSDDNTSYIYDRTLQQDTEKTSNMAKAVINASKDTGVSYVLKHFPGYGINTDTLTASSTDNHDYDDIKDIYLPPFVEGINAGAEAIMVNHIIYNSIDDENPASLSKDVIDLLRTTLKFKGIIISDDLGMGAVNDIDNNVIKAISAGNDLIIVDNYQKAIKALKDAITDGTLDENDINKHVSRVIAWKYYKGLMNTK